MAAENLRALLPACLCVLLQAYSCYLRGRYYNKHRIVFYACRGYETVDVPTARLHTGAHIPMVGLGTWKVGWPAALNILSTLPAPLRAGPKASL